MTDFEIGELAALRENIMLNKIILDGCYFHFAQNLWKNMQKKKLSLPYICYRKCV